MKLHNCESFYEEFGCITIVADDYILCAYCKEKVDCSKWAKSNQDKVMMFKKKKEAQNE